MEAFAHGILAQAASPALKDKLLQLRRHRRTVDRVTFQGLWAQFGCGALPDTVFDALCPEDAPEAQISRILRMLETDAKLRPETSAMCVGFSAEQRRKFILVHREQGLDRFVDRSLFVDLFRDARGVAPAQDLLDAIDGPMGIDAYEFQAQCAVDPSAPSAVPFALHHARKQRARHTSLLALLLYIPFAVLVTQYALTGRHILTGRDTVAALDGVLRTSSTLTERKSAAQCNACDTLDVDQNVFEDSLDTDRFYSWLEVATASLWDAAGAGGADSGQATGPLAFTTSLVGTLRIRVARYIAEDDEAVKTFFDGRADDSPLTNPIQADETGAKPRYRFARRKIDKQPIPGNASTALSAVTSNVTARMVSALEQALSYRDCDALNASLSFTGATVSFPCGGFALDIPYSWTRAEALALIQALRSTGFVTGATGAVVLETFSFNIAELSMLHYVAFHETAVGGLWLPYHTFALADQFDFRYKETFVVVLGCMLGAATLTYFGSLVYVIAQGVRIRCSALGTSGAKEGLLAVGHIFRNEPWLVLDVLNIGVLFAGAVVRWVAIVRGLSMDDFFQTEFFPRGLDSNVNLQIGAGYLEAIAVIVTYCKVLRFCRAFRPMQTLFTTIVRAFFDLTGTAVAFAILFLSFSVSAYVAYGPYLRDFESFEVAGSSMLRAIVSDMDYKAMARVHPTFTPILFAVFSIAIVLVALNMIIAVLTLAYEKACEEDASGMLPSYIAQRDPHCYLAPQRVSLWSLLSGTTLFQETALRLRTARRMLRRERWSFGWHRAPRLLYAEIEEVLDGVYHGSAEKSVRGLCTLSKEALRWAPHLVRRPMPTLKQLDRRPLQEGQADFEAFVRDVLPEADVDFLLVTFVWLPSRITGEDPLALLDELISDFVEWRRIVSMFAHIDDEPVAHTTAGNHESAVRRFRSIAFAAAGVQTTQDPDPLTWRQMVSTAAEELLDPRRPMEWTSPHLLDTCLGPPTERWQAHLSDISTSVKLEAERASVTAFASSWAASDRRILAKMLPTEESQQLNAPEVADYTSRVTGGPMPLSQQRAVEDQSEVSCEQLLHLVSQDVETLRATSFAQHFAHQQYQSTLDSLKLVPYLVFLVLFALVLVFERGLGQGLRAVSLQDPLMTTDFTLGNHPAGKVLEDVANDDELFEWLRTAVDVLAPQSASDTLPPATDHVGTRGVGAIKLRQLRVRTEACAEQPVTLPTMDLFADVVEVKLRDGCSPRYAPQRATQLRDALSVNSSVLQGLNSTVQQRLVGAFEYRTAGELRGHGSLLTSDDLYRLDGFGLFLPLNETAAESRLMLDRLQSLQWVDDFTRVVVADVVRFAPHANVLMHTGFVFHVTAGGSWRVNAVTIPFKAFSVSAQPAGYVLLLIIFAICMLYYLQMFFAELAEAIDERWHAQPNASGLSVVIDEFFSTYWWTIDVLRNLTFVATWILRAFLFAKGLGDINVSVAGEYPVAIEPLARVNIAVTLLECANFVLCGAKVMFFLRSVPELAVFTATIERSWRNILSLLLATLIILFGFALAGYSLFGELGRDFSTLPSSLSSLLLVMTLGEFGNETVVHDHNRLAFAIFFIAFVFVVQAVLLNLFIAVLTNGFADVKADVYDTTQLFSVMENDPELTFGRPTLWSTVRDSAPLREVRYWFESTKLFILGAPEGDGAEGLTKRNKVRFRNPRIFWRFVDVQLRLAETGNPTERLQAALTLIGFFADVEAMLNNPSGQRLGATVGYDASELRMASTHEPRAGSTATAASNESVSKVHGFIRRTTRDFVFQALSGETATAAELEYLTVTLPQAALGFSKGRCLVDALEALHVWRRHGIGFKNSGSSDNENEGTNSQQRRGIFQRADAFLYGE